MRSEKGLRNSPRRSRDEKLTSFLKRIELIIRHGSACNWSREEIGELWRSCFSVLPMRMRKRRCIGLYLRKPSLFPIFYPFSFRFSDLLWNSRCWSLRWYLGDWETQPLRFIPFCSFFFIRSVSRGWLISYIWIEFYCVSWYGFSKV